MKLNNKGWGTAEMIYICIALLIALLVAIYYIGKLYGSLDIATGNKEYVNLESKIEKAAREYVLLNSIEVEDQTKISFNTLKNAGYIDSLKDNNGNQCDGYVLVDIFDNIKHFYGKISCKNYQTRNY